MRHSYPPDHDSGQPPGVRHDPFSQLSGGGGFSQRDALKGGIPRPVGAGRGRRRDRSSERGDPRKLDHPLMAVFLQKNVAGTVQALTALMVTVVERGAGLVLVHSVLGTQDLCNVKYRNNGC